MLLSSLWITAACLASCQWLCTLLITPELIHIPASDSLNLSPQMQQNVCGHFSLFFFWKTRATNLAIPLNRLSRSPASFIRRTKTKWSVGYNSVRLVRRRTSDYTPVSLSLWHWCKHTRIYTPRLRNKELHDHDITGGRRQGWDANLQQPRTKARNQKLQDKENQICLSDDSCDEKLQMELG